MPGDISTAQGWRSTRPRWGASAAGVDWARWGGQTRSGPKARGQSSLGMSNSVSALRPRRDSLSAAKLLSTSFVTAGEMAHSPNMS
jgi:hypothetical protein